MGKIAEQEIGEIDSPRHIELYEIMVNLKMGVANGEYSALRECLSKYGDVGYIGREKPKRGGFVLMSCSAEGQRRLTEDYRGQNRNSASPLRYVSGVRRLPNSGAGIMY
jgi:hypothetical protein